MTRIAPATTPIVPMTSLIPAESIAAPVATPPAVQAQPSRDPRPGRLPKQQLDRAVKDALKLDPNAQFAIDRASNTATFVSGAFAMNVKPGAAGQPVDVVAAEFLRQHGTVFGVDNARTQLRLVGSNRDHLGYTHYKYQQYFNDLPVFGQQIIVHTQDSTVRSAAGRLTPNIKVAERSTALSAHEAFARVLSSKDHTLAASSVKLANDSGTLGVFTADDGTPYLAYEMDVRSATGPQSWRYYLDATSGKVLESWSTTETALNRETYDGQNSQNRPGKIARREGDGPVGDAIVNAAHDNSQAVYDFFKENFGRDSIDNRGMKLISTVHYGSKYNNAFWDGSQMTYGDGDGELLAPLALGMDVVGHEMTHGVTERTAGLQYRNQSGALNESWSDVFGNLIEKWDEARKNPGAPERDPKWLIGEVVFTPKVEGDAIRSMSAPGTAYARDPQPGHMKDYKNTANDNGGVHINSGIPNKAAYEVAMSLGRDKLAAIWYRAQTQYLTATSKFADAANVTAQAAADLYGKNSPEVTAVQNAWASVGLAPTNTPGIR